MSDRRRGDDVIDDAVGAADPAAKRLDTFGESLNELDNDALRVADGPTGAGNRLLRHKRGKTNFRELEFNQYRKSSSSGKKRQQNETQALTLNTAAENFDNMSDYIVNRKKMKRLSPVVKTPEHVTIYSQSDEIVMDIGAGSIQRDYEPSLKLVNQAVQTETRHLEARQVK